MDSKEVVGLMKKMIGEQTENGAITLSLAGMEAALNELEKIVIASGTTCQPHWISNVTKQT